MKRTNLLYLICLLWPLSPIAQQSNNPFQLEASDSMEQASDIGINPFLLDNLEQEESNPFVISAPTKPQGVQGREEFEQSRKKRVSSALNFHFLFFSGLLIFLTILITLFRSIILNFNKAFWNENILKLLHRQRPTWKASTLFLYLFFFLNLSIFIALWVNYGEKTTDGLPLLTLWTTIAVIGLVVLKHLILNILGSIFPVDKEVSLYNFTIIVFAINLGIFLLPFNLLIAFGPMVFKPTVFYLAAALILGVFAFRSLRAIFQTSRLFGQNKFHFFLYLCTVEIAPVFVLLKVVTG